MAPLNILLIGQEGQVAYELRRTLASIAKVTIRSRTTEPALDLLDFDSIRANVRALRPHIIVNAAAYTAVDKAEKESEIAFRINCSAVEVLAEEARASGSGLIHYSTDYVFSGVSTVPYCEKDPVAPLNQYGSSKYYGEEAIRAIGIPHFILRTSWVYGGQGKNFLLTLLRLMREREIVSVVDDQYGSPTWSRRIAESTASLIAISMKNGRFAPDETGGTYHLTCGGYTTWYGFAKKIREKSIVCGLLPEYCAQLYPIPTSGYPTPARRPAYSVLSNKKCFDTFGVECGKWEDALTECLTGIVPGGGPSLGGHFSSTT